MVDSLISDLKVALIQCDLFWQDVDANLSKLEELFYAKIIGGGFDLVVLPEMFTSGFGKASATLAEFMNGKTHKWLRNMAQLSDCLVLGSIPIRDSRIVFNRLLCVFPDGQTLFYNKRHLFSYGKEDHVFSPGNEILGFKYKGFAIRPLICYDLRFPVWSRNGKTDPCEVLIYVANWPNSRQYAWDHLLKARAIENQCYVLGCNRVGVDGNGLHYSGGSSIVDFQGNTLVSNQNEETVLVANLNYAELENFRKDFPFLNDSDEFQLLI